MRLRHWTDILRLMSLMVIVDGRVVEEEVRVFVYRMMELRRRLAPDMMFSEGMVRDWFSAHREEIAGHSAKERDHFLEDTLKSLDDLDTRANLVEAINAIARADGYRHEAEMKLISLAAERWDTKIPRR